MYALVFDGQVVQLSETTFDVHSSMQWIACDDSVTTEHTYDGSSFVEPTAGTPSYDAQRMAAYPSIQEQLDMQYWDSVNGTTTWADAIAAVKAQYPKPE